MIGGRGENNLVACKVVGEREQREKPCQAGGGREQGEITPAGARQFGWRGRRGPLGFGGDGSAKLVK